MPSGTRGSTGSSVSREVLPFGSPQPPINDATSRETEDDRKEESKNSMSKVYSKLGLVCYNCIDSSCFDLSGYKNQEINQFRIKAFLFSILYPPVITETSPYNGLNTRYLAT